MITKYNIDELAESYLNGSLSNNEMDQLEVAINNDPILKKEWEQAIAIYKALDHAADSAHIKNQISAIRKEKQPNILNKTIQFISHNWKNGAVAASILVAAFSTFYYLETSNKFGNKISEFTQLSREVEHIKVSQNNLRKTIEVSQSKETNQFDMSGTGFALSNDGYLATNYHVISNSKEIYITTKDNTTYPAYIVGYDVGKDIAILKVSDELFKFSKQNLPYSIIEKNEKVLGTKIFSIGYPQENLVYNEGYISAEKGFENDTLSYQLEIMANPGQSGAPILDKNGNVLGLINGKNNKTTGTTYAVQSKALTSLIKSLPEHIKIALPKHNSISKLDRTDQVEILKNYVVTIKAIR